MTPSARLQATLDLLAEIQDSWCREGPAADDLIARYFRKRRYAGSKDRRDIIGRIYDILRTYEVLKWRVLKAGSNVAPRTILIAALMEEKCFDEKLFGGDLYGMATLDDDERRLLASLQKEKAEPPLSARWNVPEWLEKPLRLQFGEEFEVEMSAMAGRAPFDLRVNRLKTDRATLLKKLQADGMTPTPTPWSQDGIRFHEPQRLSDHKLFHAGHFEIQDESAQIAALMCDTKPGMQVIDLCAGAGGKTLALAVGMKNKGQIYACDPNKKRIGELKKRMQRAGVRNIQTLIKPPDISSQKADRVILDVPCSGTGTWRRNPELRQRLTGERLDQTAALQQELLGQGALFTKPGGRLIYMTCSILEAENESRIEHFLNTNKDWKLVDYRQILKDLGLSSLPESWSRLEKCLLLAPGRHDTDGFFTAVLEFSG